MMHFVRTIPLLALLALPACFMSQVSNVATGTLLADGTVEFCSPDQKDCQTGTVDGDAYIVKSETEDEEDMRLKFDPLVIAGEAQIYLGEAELREDGESAWAYLVARASTEMPNGVPRFIIIMPGCNDFDEETRSRYSVERADSYTCSVSDFGAFKQFLLENYSERFADDAWWADKT